MALLLHPPQSLVTDFVCSLDTVVTVLPLLTFASLALALEVVAGYSVLHASLLDLSSFVPAVREASVVLLLYGGLMHSNTVLPSGYVGIAHMG